VIVQEPESRTEPVQSNDGVHSSTGKGSGQPKRHTWSYARNLSSGTPVRLAPVQSSVPKGQYPGLDQVNVPQALAGKGESDLKLSACDADANTVKIDIR